MSKGISLGLATDLWECLVNVFIGDLDPVKVLIALHTNAKPQGMGYLNPRWLEPLTYEEAEQLLKIAAGGIIDYAKGRVLKVILSDEEFDPRHYDRDNGLGAAARVIAHLRKTGNPYERILSHD